MPQARKFTELGVSSDAPLPAVEQIDTLARLPENKPADDEVASPSKN